MLQPDRLGIIAFTGGPGLFEAVFRSPILWAHEDSREKIAKLAARGGFDRYVR
jgi:hypothetical protein